MNVNAKVQDLVNFSFDNYELNKGKAVVINNPDVDYTELTNELTRIINLTKEGKKFENFHSLFIFGPTGVGKSEICKQIAEMNGCIYHKLEIQKVPLEEFEGFPYLEDRAGRKVVRLAQPTVLPPSGDKGVWVLHLDEFNKADTEKMAAVMNLVLTGEIGGTADYNEKTGKSEKYRLPERTVIIGSGNFKTQEKVENLNIVNQMDIATSERFHRAVYLNYNAESWIKNFAIKEYTLSFNGEKYFLSTRIPSIILFYVMEKANENGNKAPFLIPVAMKPDEGGSERTTSPRCWTLVSDNMILDGITKYNTLPKNNQYITMSEKMYGNTDRAFDLFMSDPNNQIELLSNQSLEFGLEGQKIVADIISRFKYFYDNRIVPDNIINSYKQYREKISKLKEKTGSILSLLLGIGYYLDRTKTDYDSKSIRVPGVNLSTFIEDCNIPAEDLSAFIHILIKSESKAAKSIHDFLLSISERYKIAYGDYYYTSEVELKNGSKAGSNK